MKSLNEFLTNDVKNYIVYDINRIKIDYELLKSLDKDYTNVLRYEMKDNIYHIYTDFSAGGC